MAVIVTNPVQTIVRNQGVTFPMERCAPGWIGYFFKQGRINTCLRSV